LGAPVGALLIANGAIDPYLAVPTRFWIGSLIAGLVFGIGMIFAGGCASGSLWRVGEGHLKLVATVFCFGWSGSLASGILGKLELTNGEYDLDFMDGMAEISPLGFQAFMPNLLGGWGWTLFGLVWGLAAIGVVTKMFAGIRWHGLSTIVYVVMGWLVLIAAKPLWDSLPTAGLLWLLAGGIAYTGGVFFYVRKDLRYGHLVWHLFVLAGTVCHFVAVWKYAIF
jgi:hypothetical protein